MGGRVRALILLSGGLDSTLAAKLLLEQEIDLIGLGFSSPFYSTKRGRKAAEWLGIPFIEIDISSAIWEVVKNPKHGYGKNMNPCIDCHALMLKKAKEIMPAKKALFVATGEVLGERPMSQNREALQIVAREASLEGLVLRPLSAKLLPPTIPEERGWVDREKLLALQGRSRKPQMELAEKYGLKDYPTPAGGCLLTDPGFSERLRELLSRRKDKARLEDLELLKLGRHFWFDGGWVVIPRNQQENEKIKAVREAKDYLIKVKDRGSPLTLVRGEVTPSLLKEASLLTIRYSQAREEEEARVEITGPEGTREEVYRWSEWERYLG